MWLQQHCLVMESGYGVRQEQGKGSAGRADLRNCVHRPKEQGLPREAGLSVVTAHRKHRQRSGEWMRADGGFGGKDWAHAPC